MFRIIVKSVMFCLLLWSALCFLSFLSAIVVTSIGSPRWLPVPWSDFNDFAETADGRVFVDIAFFNRVLRYNREGRFIGSYPYPAAAVATRDTELAATKDGRLLFRSQHRLFVLDSSMKLQDELECDFRTERNWRLDTNGTPVCVSDVVPGSLIVNGLIEPGDQMFANKPRRSVFRCGDGALLVRRGNRLERHAPDGSLVTTYSAPVLLWPLEFPWPASLAWVCFFGTIIVLAVQRYLESDGGQGDGNA